MAEQQQIGQIDADELEQIQQEATDYLTAAYEDFKHRLCMDYLVLNQKQQTDGGKFEHMKKVLDMIPGNSTVDEIDCKTCLAKAFCWLVVPCIWLNTRSIFEVEANKFAFVVYRSKEGAKTLIYGPGYHILGYNYTLEGIYSFDQEVPNNIIQSSVGDLKIAKVEQGYIMCMEHQGQNVLLGPGIHLITEPMTFIEYKNLDSFFINIGPEKWITIPSGYDGISLNKGKLQILNGGSQHYLSHVAERFIKIVPKTLQTDKIPTDIPSYVHNLTAGDEARIRNNQNYRNNQKQLQQQQKNKKGGRYGQNQNQPVAQLYQTDYKKVSPNDPSQILKTTTAEGSTVSLDTMMQWRIADTKLAALTAMEILKIGRIGNETDDENDAISASSKNICNLRLTTLRIAKNHLTCMVGSINLAGQSALSTQIKGKYNPDAVADDKQPLVQNNQPSTNFDILETLQGQTSSLKDLINEDLSKIGCVCDNICIYKVTPSSEIQAELDKQTRARVDSNTAMIKVQAKKKSCQIDMEMYNRNNLKQAISEAQVIKMDAKTYADSKITRANGEAEAIKTVAQARKEEAEKLQEFSIAKHLAITRVAGEVGEKLFSGDSNNVIYGSNPAEILQGIVTSVQNQKH